QPRDIVSGDFYWFLLFASSVELLRIVIWAIVKKKPGGWTVAWGILGFLFLFIGLFFFVLTVLGGFDKVDWTSAGGILISALYVVGVLCVPVSMSVYLARQFAQTNKSLTKKLIEVNELSEKSIEQEKEKQKILETQKENLEREVKERTAEITEQSLLLHEKNKDITDSINYAQKIQEAILPAKEIKYKLFPKAFVLFQPRDIVSGDFYWFTEVKGTPPSRTRYGGQGSEMKGRETKDEGKVMSDDPLQHEASTNFRIIAAADCTGHGVPGAFMSMIGNAFLNEIVNQKKITKPSEILNLLRENVIHSLKQTGADGENKDGMDIALCCFDEANETLQFAGANNPLWIIRKGKCTEYTANKQPIGFQIGNKTPFTNHEIKIEKGDTCYMFTDGFADQFGGPKGKKFKYRQLQEILISIQDKSMSEQEIILQDAFMKWKGELEQIDDVLLIGVRVV
ncbi:MAG: SpoIIE family protein phosphatase, partial [Bacteroidia bacterium]|nr:SpoIIE family protein phosphatase [Bacteroidia bacterium]